jgi:hypothetical protein
MEVSGQLYTQGKSPWYPLDRRLDGPQSRSGHGAEEKNSQPLQGLQPLIIQPVAQPYTAELTRLLLEQCNATIQCNLLLRNNKEHCKVNITRRNWYVLYAACVYTMMYATERHEL